MTERNAEARANVAEFLRQWSKMRGNDPELVYQVHSDPNTDEASLRISDLQELIKESA